MTASLGATTLHPIPPVAMLHTIPPLTLILAHPIPLTITDAHWRFTDKTCFGPTLFSTRHTVISKGIKWYYTHNIDFIDQLTLSKV